jgi:membrane protease YdiL (CAAX protease family)
VSRLKEFQLEMLAWLCLAVAAGGLVAALWFLTPPARRRLWPRPRLHVPRVPWGGLEVLAAVILLQLVALWVHDLLNRAGFFTAVYGPDFPSPYDQAEPSPERQLALDRRMLWVSCLSFPLEVVAVVALLRLISGAKLYHLGLSPRRGVGNVTAGYLTWLYLAPVVFAFNGLVLWAYARLVATPPDEHSLTRLLENHASWFEWLLAFFAAVAAAPVVEELLFRGVLQAWLLRQSWGGHAAMAGAFLAALGQRGNKVTLHEALGGGVPFATLLDALSPALFVLAMVPGYLLAGRLARRWLPSAQAARAVYATALFFAAFHSAVWPSPVALFLLGLGLGYLAYRTRSLVGPIVLHALFNGVSCLTLAFAYGMPTP